MAFNDHTYEQIQRYLEGEMSASERQAFEQKMASDEALAQEVTLQKDISNLLSDTPESELRKNLQTLNDQYQESPSGGRSWKNLIWLAPLLLIFGIWFFRNSTNENLEEISTTVSTETIDNTVGTSIEKDTSNTPQTEPSEPKEKITKPADNQRNNTEKQLKKDSIKTPIYVDQTNQKIKKDPIEPPMLLAAPSLLNHDFFAPLPLLDSLIAQNFQNEQFQINIQQPIPDTLTLEEVQKSNYSFTATLLLSTNLPLSLSETGLYLYPNHAFYWNENYPWDFTASNVEETAANKYQIQLMPNLNLETGLYYYALRSSKEGEVFFVGKLMVIE